MKRRPKILDSKTLTAITSQVASSRLVRRLVQKRLKNMSGSKRYIPILPDIQLLNLDGTPARDQSDGSPAMHSHVQLIRWRLVYPAFVSDTPKDQNTVHWTMAMIVSQQTIFAKLVNIKPGDYLDLDEDDWLLLKRSVEKGTTYNPVVAMSTLPFMRAITTAPTEHPEKAKKALAAHEKEAKTKAKEEGEKK